MRVSPWRCASAASRLSSSGPIARYGLPTSAFKQGPYKIRTQRGLRSTPLTAIRQFTTTRIQHQDEVKLTSFAELRDHGLVHENIVRSITDSMKLETMTEVQSATIRSALKGTDVIAQAKTGTGKTLAFLIPLLQRMVQEDPDLARSTYRPQRTTADDIRGIVISPTRELAEQIAVEARKVVSGTGIIVQTAVGGTMKTAMLRQMQRQGCHLLVGTPGRLEDLFSDERSGVAAPRLQALVLDEADRLLDQGFWPDIQTFMQLLPPREEVDRQTLMFSATIPKEVVHIVRQTLKPGFQFARVIGDTDVPTIERVKQNLVILRGYENQLPALLEICWREVEAHKADPQNKRPFKAIVYFRSLAEVTFAANVFRSLSTTAGKPQATDAFGIPDRRRGDHPLPGCRIYDIHSKLTQQQRTYAAESFRQAESAILFSSDVTARGMDFPNVTHVFQLGQPQDRESYIHRIGRTGRAGKEGEGWILVHEMEVTDVDRMLNRIPIDEDTSTASATVDLTTEGGREPGSPALMVLEAAKRTQRRLKSDVYKIIVSQRQGGNKFRAAQQANDLAIHGWGMTEPPTVSPGLAQRLGLSNVHGITIGTEEEEDDYSSGRSGRFGRGSEGGRFGREGGRFGRDRGDSDRNGRGRFGGNGGGSRFGGGRSNNNDPFALR